MLINCGNIVTTNLLKYLSQINDWKQKLGARKQNKLYNQTLKCTQIQEFRKFTQAFQSASFFACMQNTWISYDN